MSLVLNVQFKIFGRIRSTVTLDGPEHLTANFGLVSRPLLVLPKCSSAWETGTPSVGVGKCVISVVREGRLHYFGPFAGGLTSSTPRDKSRPAENAFTTSMCYSIKLQPGWGFQIYRVATLSDTDRTKSIHSKIDGCLITRALCLSSGWTSCHPFIYSHLPFRLGFGISRLGRWTQPLQTFHIPSVGQCTHWVIA